MKIIAIHSLNESNLNKVLDIDGFVMPSISISKYNQAPTNFGNISFILKEDSFNPKNIENIIYNKDFYSTRVPTLYYLINAAEVQKLLDHMDDIIKNDLLVYSFKELESTYINLKQNPFFKYFYLKETQPQNINFDLKYDEINNQHELFLDENLKAFFIENYNNIDKKNDELIPLIKKSLEKYYNYLEKNYDSEIINLLFLPLTEIIKDGKINFSSKEFQQLKNATHNKNELKLDVDSLKNNLNKIVVEEDYVNFINKKLKNIFHTPHLKIDNKKIEYTKENIFKIMKKSSLKGSESDMVFINSDSIAATYAKRLTSMKSIFEEANFLTHEKDRNDKIDLLNKNIFDAYVKISPYFPKELSTSSDSLFSKSMRNVQRMEDLKFNLIKNGVQPNIPDDLIANAFKYLDEIKATSTHYFEGKLKRIVDFDEFLAVVLPINISPSIIEKLKNKNIKIEFYKNEEERISIYEKYSLSEPKIIRKNKI